MREESAARQATTGKTSLESLDHVGGNSFKLKAPPRLQQIHPHSVRSGFAMSISAAFFFSFRLLHFPPTSEMAGMHVLGGAVAALLLPLVRFG